ncbi:hypothetical protein FACS189431_8570 [Alphaproteobacteria bacterium]|nr:hypothetical protein FACS189431_8570 [Alphaproteobacteria bacterium]
MVLPTEQAPTDTEVISPTEGLDFDPVKAIIQELNSQETQSADSVYSANEAMILIDAGRIWQVMNHLDQFDINGEMFVKMYEAIEERRLKELIIEANSIDKTALTEMIGNWGEDFVNNLAAKKNSEIGEERIERAELRFSEKLVVAEDIGRVTRGHVAGVWHDNAQSQLNYNEVFQMLTEHSQVWQDNANVVRPMRAGAEIFGYDRMFQFIGRKGVSRHDQLYAFDAIINLFDSYKGQHPDIDDKKAQNIFFNDVLLQVKMDTSLDENGNSSYQRLNDIANNYDFSDDTIVRWREQVGRLEEKGFAEEMQKLRSMLDNGSYLDSWKSLTNFCGLVDQLNHADVFEKLTAIKAESRNNPKKARLYEYVRTLLFHKDSTVNAKMAEQFFADPESFLENDDAHAPRGLHNALKPSNYVEQRNLDLTSKELVGALVNGDIDKIQAFPSMEVIYEVNSDWRSHDSNEPKLLRDVDFIEGQGPTFIGRVMDELGSREKGNANPKLFGEIRKLLNSHGVSIQKDKLLSELRSNLIATPELESEIGELLHKYPNRVNVDRREMQNPTSQGATRYRATVYPKSDPAVALAGNDTACCMWFGSGKNNVYMFNPNTALFALQIEKADGSWRTVAQSVLTLDQDIGISPDQLLKNQNMSEIVTGGGANLIACDNIEVAPNWKTDKRQQIIGEIYQAFFTNYAQAFNQGNLTGSTVDTDKIVIGQGNSDHSFGQSIANTYLPKAPISYSDKLGSSVDIIGLNKSETPHRHIVPVSERITQARQEIYPDNLPTSIQPLTYQDALDASKIESVAYPRGMEQGITELENDLIAKDINNATKGRPNLSFKAVNHDGRMTGYFIAHESYLDDHDDELGIYIEDIAALPDNMLAGGRMIRAFIDQYKEQYIDKGNLLPIYAEARDSTSYQILVKHLNKISNESGVDFVMQELGTYNRGGETMHKVIIAPNARRGK